MFRWCLGVCTWIWRLPCYLLTSRLQKLFFGHSLGTHWALTQGSQRGSPGDPWVPGGVCGPQKSSKSIKTSSSKLCNKYVWKKTASLQRNPPPTLKIGFSCTRNHRFHECHQTLKCSEIAHNGSPFGAYFGNGSVDLGLNWSHWLMFFFVLCVFFVCDV